MNKYQMKSALFAIAALVAFNAGSSVAATSNQSVAKKPRSLKDSVMLTYWGDAALNSIESPFSANTPNSGNVAGAMGLYSSIQAGYKFNSAQALYINPRFTTQLARSASGTGFGQTAWLNPRVGFKDSKMWVSKSGNTSLYGNIHAELPMGDGSNTSLAIAPGFSNYLSVKFPGSRWSYGQWSTLRFYFYGRAPETEQKILQIEFYPEMQYKISKSVNFRFLTRFEYGAKGSDGASLRENVDNVTFLLQPGITWDITKSINVNPYIQIQPKEGFSLSSSSIGMEISGTVF